MRHDTDDVAGRVREGRFQRWLSLIAGLSSVLGGLEVAYEHYRGSYSRRVMYTPVVLSAALGAAGVAGFASRRAARTVLPTVATLTLVDAAAGFYFHVRGIARKPGGWSLPVTNVVMGPPVFAPLLFGVSAYLGIVASLLRRGDDGTGPTLPQPAGDAHWARGLFGALDVIDVVQDVREGRFQQQLAVATFVAAGLSGVEAGYSHWKNAFRYRVQWTPLVVAAALMAAAAGATIRTRVAHTWLPALSAVAIVNGTIGFGYHVRGVLRRPGGTRLLAYNVVYGPPLFAPLLFAASGSLGVLASLLRRSS